MATTTYTHWSDALVRMGACDSGVEYARQYGTLAAAWAACTDARMMLWLWARHAGEPWSDGRKPLVMCCCEIARVALPVYESRYPGDDRPRAALEDAESWACGNGTLESATTAAADAYAAAADAASAVLSTAASTYDAASAVLSAATASTSDAASAVLSASAAAATAAYAAAYAVTAATSAVYAAYAAAYACAVIGEATGTAALARYADIVRKHLPTPPDSWMEEVA